MCVCVINVAIYTTFAFHVQAMTVLNHAGVCASYVNTWKYLRQLSSEAQFLDVVRSGHWMFVYDNLNMSQRVRHEREGMMLTYTHTHIHNVTILYTMYMYISTCTLYNAHLCIRIIQTAIPAC